MYFVYVDESGDTGEKRSNYFILTGVIMYKKNWKEIIENIYNFRKEIKEKYRLNIREEIHASEFMHNAQVQKSKKSFERIPKHIRLMILKKFLECINNQKIKTFSVIIDKKKCNEKEKILEKAWDTFLNRLDTTLENKNCDEIHKQLRKDKKCIIISDETTSEIIRILRKKKRYNAVPSKFNFGEYLNRPISNVIEDPFMKKSHDSYMLQIADSLAFFVKQTIEPHFFIKKQGAKNYYLNKLINITLKEVSSSQNGLVMR